MSKASEEAALRYPPRYWPGYEPDGDHPGKLAYLDGITTDDLREAFDAGAQWQAEQQITDAKVQVAMGVLFARMSDDDPERRYFTGLVRSALEAARKTLME